jgi:hypothetical protein
MSTYTAQHNGVSLRRAQFVDTTTARNKQTPWSLFREGTIPTERQPLVNEI